MSSGIVRARRGWSVMTLTAALFASFLAWAPNASAAEEDPRFPGLPTIDGNFMPGTVQTPQIGGVQEVAAAKQWFRMPMILMGADYHIEVEPDPDSTDPISPYKFFSVMRAYVLAPDGPPYGHVPPMHVRSVAFGAIPVEYTIHLDQLREDDLPIPWVARMQTYFSPPAGNEDALIEGLGNLRVANLKIDGVPVDVGDACRTSSPVSIELIGKGWRGDLGVGPGGTVNDVWKVTDRYGQGGGLLTGTVDVPPFTGCVTPSGDDMSPILTAMGSGPNNRTTQRQSNFFFESGCWAFSGTSSGECTPPEVFAQYIPMPTS